MKKVYTGAVRELNELNIIRNVYVEFIIRAENL